MEMYSPRLDRIVEAFAGNDVAVQDLAVDALAELSRNGLTPHQGAYALRAATRPMDSEFSAMLVAAVAETPHIEYVSTIAELFELYSDDARIEALWLLARLDDDDAVNLYLDLLRNRAESGTVPGEWLAPLDVTLMRPEKSLPTVMSLQTDPAIAKWQLLRRYLEHDLIDADFILPWKADVFKLFDEIVQPLRERQEKCGEAWIWTSDYAAIRDIGLTSVYLLGRLGDPDSLTRLSAILDFGDPVLVGYAAIALTTAGTDVPADRFRLAADSPEMRKWLYEELAAIDRLDTFPADKAGQDALAESDMFNWLIRPDELGRPPTALELMNILTFDTADPEVRLDYYLFRFLEDETPQEGDFDPDGDDLDEPHTGDDAGEIDTSPSLLSRTKLLRLARHADSDSVMEHLPDNQEPEEDEWLTGFAGPFLHGGPPSAGGYDTGSEFVPWSDRDPKDHLPSREEIIARWEAYLDDDVE